MSVIIVSWNVCDLLRQCLDALRARQREHDLAMEVIVVDNASTDGTRAMLAERSDVRALLNDGNIGYGRANNQGMSAALGRYLLILNPDTIPLRGSIDALVRFAGSKPGVGIAGPRLLNPDGSVQRNAFRFPTLLMAAIELFSLPRWVPGRLRRRLLDSSLNGRYPDEPHRDRPFRIDHPLGACMLIRRAAYEEVGGFDPGLFMYSEDVDLCLRYGKAGYECWQVPEAKVVHFGGQSTQQMPDRMYVELWRSRLYFQAKRGARFTLLGIKTLLLLSAAGTATFATVRGLLRPGARHEARQARRRARFLLRVLAEAQGP